MKHNYIRNSCGALINTDEKDYQIYKMAIERKKKEAVMASMQNDIDQLKALVSQFLEKTENKN